MISASPVWWAKEWWWWWAKEWVETIMNETILDLVRKAHAPTVYGGWYIVDGGTIMWRESDGRSPVEPTVPGD